LQQRASKAGRAPVAVIVMGVSGCGKSTVGTLLSEALGCRFVEGDTLHDPAAVAKMQAGIPLTDEDRWPWLDRIGAAANDALVTDDRVVIACSALRRSYRLRLSAAISGTTRFLHLDNGRDEILRRLMARSHEFMPPALLDSQFAILDRPAGDEPAKTLFSNVCPDALCRQAIDWLEDDSAVSQGVER
jgi:gluconokinase